MTYSQWCLAVVVICASAIGLAVSLGWGEWPGIWLGLLINTVLFGVAEKRP